MAITLPPLPYPVGALEPAISAATLAVHHGKHHKAYVDKTNALIAGTDLADEPLEAVVIAARDTDPKLFNPAAQAWNHGFYWHSLAPEESHPDASLNRAIDAAFGSREGLIKQLAAEGEGHFGSGWVWLLADGAELSVASTHDAGCPLGGKARPLLVIDVWEHAYYLDRKNDRKGYLAAAAGLINWAFASANFARDEVWRYPG